MKRIRRFEAYDYSGLCGRFEIESEDGIFYPVYWVRTWLYGMKYQLWTHRDEWSQLVLAWHGKHGLKQLWIPVAE